MCSALPAFRTLRLKKNIFGNSAAEESAL
uniref:Uncharacterized protein n=1 Tax=Anguilla anguilla TaxID=7936 RepID=A0A0E9RC10_ANGAN